MNRFRFAIVAAWLAVCAGAPAFAQNIRPVSGNGQLICQACSFNIQGFFQPLVVQVTDANGNPVAGATVLWALTSGNLGLGGQLALTSTTTDQNGLSSNTALVGFPPQGNAFQSYLQNTVTATTGSSTATFTLTQALQDATNVQISPVGVFAPTSDPSTGNATQPLLAGSAITGQAGTTSPLPIEVKVLTEAGFGIPNVAITLYNFQSASTGPVLQCASSAGAGNNTVLTDSTGLAVCNPVFGGAPGNGTFEVLIGATASNDPTVEPVHYWVFPGNGLTFSVSVTPAAAGALKVVSGTPQTAQAGQSGAPLVVEVDSTAGSPLAGQPVTWTVSPSGAATLGNSSTTTGTNGQTSNTVTLSSSASGTVTVTAANSGHTASFTLTATVPVRVTGLSVVSGSGQTAIINTAFGAPLVVQVNTSAGPAVGTPVLFTISGPATLSSQTAATNNSGQASVNVTAGGTPGAVTVTASTNGFSGTFNLTVAPAGPTLLANSFLNGADFQLGALSPCSIATIIATGLAPGLQTMVVSSSVVGPLDFKLAGDSVTVAGSQAPIYSVGRNGNGQEQLTFQVPCDVQPGGSVPVVVNVGPGNATINIPIQAASPGIFETVMTDGQFHPVVIRPDGSFVSLQNPARKGEQVVAFATGMGPASPPVATDAVPAPGPIGPSAQYTIVVGMSGGGVPLTSAVLSPDLVGVWMVTFTIPATVATGNDTFSISVIPPGASAPISSGTSTIPVQ